MFEKKVRNSLGDYIVGLAMVLVGGGSISTGTSCNNETATLLYLGGILWIIFGLLIAFSKGKF